MWPLKKKIRSAVVRDQAARMIATGIVALQLRIVGMLQRVEKKLSTGHKKVLLLLFCLVGCGYCSYLLASAFYYRTQEVNPVISIEEALPPGLPPPPVLLKDSTKVNR